MGDLVKRGGPAGGRAVISRSARDSAVSSIVGVSAAGGGAGPIWPRTPEELSREFEPTAQSIANWVRQAERDAGKRPDCATSVKREGLIRLRRENHRLRQEHDILSKAAAWFARESNADPNGFSGL